MTSYSTDIETKITFNLINVYNPFNPLEIRIYTYYFDYILSNVSISETARRLGKQTTLGEEMLRAKNGGQPLPVVISDSAGDSRQMKSVKTLIRGMTAYSPTQRTKMREVVSTLEEADGGMFS